MSIGEGLKYLAAGLAVFTAFGSQIGQGYATGKAVDAVGKNPEAISEIRSILILGLGMSETGGIYGLLIAFIILFMA